MIKIAEQNNVWRILDMMTHTGEILTAIITADRVSDLSIPSGLILCHPAPIPPLRNEGMTVS